MDYNTLLFDLDGTISDPLLGIARSFNFALRSLGFEERAEAELASCIGPPLDHSFLRLTNCSNPDLVREFVSQYRDRYSNIGYSENTLYPGIEVVLSTLSNAGIQLGICTSKRKDFAEKIIHMFGLESHFAFINGGDIGIHKIEQISALLKNAQIDLSTVMIGDRQVDLQAAHRTGIDSAGFLWGYGSEHELFTESPKFLLTSPTEILTLIQ